MRFIFSLSYSIARGAIVFGLPIFVFAQPGIPNTNVSNVPDLYQKACVVSNWVFGFVMIIAVIALLMGAIKFFTSGGSQDEVKRARQYVIFSLVGVAVAILAKAFIFIIGDFFGVAPTGLFDCA